MNITELPLELIDEDADQPRYQFDEDALQELKNSIAELGLLSPIKVRTADNGRYTIIYGNRRYKAAQSLGLKKIPCIISTAMSELDIYLEQIAENLTREGFSPIEEAEAFHKLMNDTKFSSSIKFLSSKLGKPESYIRNKLELLKFGPAVKKLIVAGTQIRKDKLTEDQLLPLKDLPIEHRDPLALIMARDGMPVSDVKKIARLFKDKGISQSVKDKLLYKNGPDLIETWSSYQQTKAERARADEERKAAAEAKASASQEQADRKETSRAEAGAMAGSAAHSQVPGLQPSACAETGTHTGKAGIDTAEVSSAIDKEPSDSQPSDIPGIAAELENILTALAAVEAKDIKDLNRLTGITPQVNPVITRQVDQLIMQLEQQLSDWKKIRERLESGS
ncbi:ParB/RepB/Spo0J family partition protein [Paenibacillus tarimensis]|uniref:ParB/RepB/Spo0J family partition protein n=1 Tax=Paenibacillus tarimensis TaxID=416012 RepID=UPI001F2A55CE|nr:ParB/RepB/Spo0J family partition protein [Paenibacillus tarimensis]MCF2944603.1 ParB/RepB/Spo0J family partition protein [Paenibacillus tarimensis]